MYAIDLPHIKKVNIIQLFRLGYLNLKKNIYCGRYG